MFKSYGDIVTSSLQGRQRRKINYINNKGGKVVIKRLKKKNSIKGKVFIGLRGSLNIRLVELRISCYYTRFKY